MDETRTWFTKRSVTWGVLAGFAFVASASLLVIPWFGWPSLSDTDGSFALSILLAAWLVGGLSWLGVERYARHRPILGGFVAGIVTGIVSHPVAWFLGPILDLEVQAGGSAFLTPFMSIYSLLFVGWITVPLGILAGVVVGLARVAVTRWTRRSESPSDEAGDSSPNAP